MNQPRRSLGGQLDMIRDKEFYTGKAPEDCENCLKKLRAVFCVGRIWVDKWHDKVCKKERLEGRFCLCCTLKGTDSQRDYAVYQLSTRERIC